MTWVLLEKKDPDPTYLGSRSKHRGEVSRMVSVTPDENGRLVFIRAGQMKEETKADHRP